MSLPPNTTDPEADASDVLLPSDAAGAAKLMAQIGASVQRMRSQETFNDQGVKRVWHRGKGDVELFTWENEQKQILTQELSFMGRVVEFRRGRMLRTGRWPAAATQPHPASKLITHDTVPAADTLGYASDLLRHIPKRDFYGQHLLHHVNDLLVTSDADSNRTIVMGLDRFERRNPWFTTTIEGTALTGLSKAAIAGVALAIVSLLILAAVLS